MKRLETRLRRLELTRAAMTPPSPSGARERIAARLAAIAAAREVAGIVTTAPSVDYVRMMLAEHVATLRGRRP